MRALSVRQPWAWAILHAGKRVENRTRHTNHRGPFLLHAAMGPDPTKRGGQAEYEAAVRWMVQRGLARSPLASIGSVEEIMLRVAEVDLATLPLIPPLEELPRGGIVGRATLVDVLLPATNGIPRRPWHMPDCYGFALEDVAELPFEKRTGCPWWFYAPEPAAAHSSSDTGGG